MNYILISCIIPCKSLDDPNLQDLLDSIKAQDFPQDQIETIVVTEGDSEQAKAIGIRKAKGKICAMFCADNMLTDNRVFKSILKTFNIVSTTLGVYSKRYSYKKGDNSLNRYFSLIGGNDVICYYLGKNDRKPWYNDSNSYVDIKYFKGSKFIPSLGCNGTFINRKLWIEHADLDHYYPMDCAVDVINKVSGFWIRRNVDDVWHRTTDGNLIKFLIKRYKYARDLYSDRTDRRWRMLDTKSDYWKLVGFICATITVIQPIIVSVYGFIKIRDFAWFWHWPVSVGFLITYGILVCRNILKSASLFLQSVVKNVFRNVYKV